MAFTHTQTHSETHTDSWAHTHTHTLTLTHTHTHSGIDSASYVWGQFILPQVVPDWIWSESHYVSPCLTLSCPTHRHTHTKTHTHTYTCTYTHTHTNVLSKPYQNTHTHTHTHTGSLITTQVRSCGSGADTHTRRQTHTGRYWLCVTLSRWDHFYWFRKRGHSDQCYLLVCCVIRAEPECQNIWLSRLSS